LRDKQAVDMYKTCTHLYDMNYFRSFWSYLGHITWRWCIFIYLFIYSFRCTTKENN